MIVAFLYSSMSYQSSLKLRIYDSFAHVKRCKCFLGNKWIEASYKLLDQLLMKKLVVLMRMHVVKQIAIPHAAKS